MTLRAPMLDSALKSNSFRRGREATCGGANDRPRAFSDPTRKAEIPGWVYREFDLSDDDSAGELIQQVLAQLKSRLGNRMRDLQILATSDGLVLRGVVTSYYGKQLAQEVVMEVSGHSVLANDIEVQCVELGTVEAGV